MLSNGVNAISKNKNRRRSDKSERTAVITIDAETTNVTTRRHHHRNKHVKHHHQHYHRHHNMTRIKNSNNRRRYDETERNGTTFLDESLESHRQSSAATMTQAPKTSLCAETTFDADEYICCDGSLRMRFGVSSACCGRVAYDQFLFRCCDDGRVRMSCSADYQPKKSVWGILV
jgi:hypothetical protein